VSVILIGLAAGAEVDLFAYLTSRYFGLKRYGSIYGVVFMVFSVSAGLAPAVFGLSFDLYGSYDLIFPIAAVLSIIGGLAMLLLGAYPDFEAKTVNQLSSS
jgi:OFA family oxalate/formate antiporter-like MFS transporter